MMMMKRIVLVVFSVSLMTGSALAACDATKMAEVAKEFDALKCATDAGSDMDKICKCNTDNIAQIEKAMDESGCKDDAAAGAMKTTIESAKKANTDAGCKEGADAGSAAQASALPSFVALTLVSTLLLAVARA